MGNRGILHDADGRLGRSRWRHSHWIACRIEFRGRHREVMSPGTWTELFFLDEAVALAAGHRPCAECRRGDYLRFLDAWQDATGCRPRAGSLDRALHASRLLSGTRRQATFHCSADEVPEGAFVRVEAKPYLVLAGRLRRFSTGGYTRMARLPAGPVEVLTPLPIVEALRAGYRPELHTTA